jgi:hypothetical protein
MFRRALCRQSHRHTGIAFVITECSDQQGCAAVHREFGRLKNEWALSPLRVRGLDQVRLHADLTILAELACALARGRIAALAGLACGVPS